MTTQTVITRLTTLFCTFGLPRFVHTDRSSYFSSKEFEDFLHLRGIATSRTTPYHPIGNSHNEKLSQAIWKTIKLMLHSIQMPEKAWETVLQDATHCSLILLSGTLLQNVRLYYRKKHSASFAEHLLLW